MFTVWLAPGAVAVAAIAALRELISALTAAGTEMVCGRMLKQGVCPIIAC
jgi:hypothetical protein